jgi:hypothetical protein
MGKLFRFLKLADTRGDVDFNIDMQKPVALRQTRIPSLTLDHQKSLKDTIGELLNLGMIREVITVYVAPSMMVKKRQHG